MLPAKNSNCFKVHPDIPSAPCIRCHKPDPSSRYTHLSQFQSSEPPFYDFICRNINLNQSEGPGCICRKCNLFLKRSHEKEISGSIQNLEEKDNGASSSKQARADCIINNEDFCFLQNFSMCDETGKHKTNVDLFLFQNTFNLELDDKFPDLNDSFSASLCHKHYNVLSNSKKQFLCEICGCSSARKKFVLITAEKLGLFSRFLKYIEKNSTGSDKTYCCSPCYNSFNKFCRSNDGEEARFQTDSYFIDCLQDFKFDDEVITPENVDFFSFQSVYKHVIECFLQETPMLIPSLYNFYLETLDKNITFYKLTISELQKLTLQHNTTWLLRLLKSRVGRGLLVFVPNKKQLGSMIYRNGSNLLNSLHSSILSKQVMEKKKNEEICFLQKKNTVLNAELNKKRSSNVILNDCFQVLKPLVKSYISSKVNLPGLPNISQFNALNEIHQIPPLLWNFLFRLSATDSEDIEWLKTASWSQHFIGKAVFPDRLFPRLFLASCIFNTRNSQCVEPLHLLLTDVFDKFSCSSSLFLSISARLGVSVSKDSLKRYIANRCIELEKRQRHICSNSFVIASFDNLDKNQSYSSVGVGKEKSGFHGTTIQTVTPCPDIIKPTSDDISINMSSSSFSDSYLDSTAGQVSRARMVSESLVTDIVNPSDKIGPPAKFSENRFSNLSVSDFECSSLENAAYGSFSDQISKYGFSKLLFQDKKIILPGVKTFFSIPLQATQKSEFSSVAVLDQNADKKETVLQVLNILHDKFQVGSSTSYVVVVGDGKSYDHLVKLKNEYGSTLNWVLPYPGDWHILKNILPIFIKVYLDAGLKPLATRFHHAATLRILTECSKFALTHKFMIQVWEAIFRYQINTFLSVTDKTIVTQPFDTFLLDIFSNLDTNYTGEEICDESVWTAICTSRDELFSVFSPELLVQFSEWRRSECSKSDTFAFWDSFIHVDYLQYLGLYFSIRTRNWHLRNACLKHLAPLFHAFDKHNYLRMIPYHLADLHTFPPEVVDFFAKGGFSVSISGEDFHSVALDEAHEMEINLKTKNALNSFTPTSLATLTFYLPYRAETLHNLKTQLELNSNSQPHHFDSSKPAVELEERNIFEYFQKLQQSSLFSLNDRKTLHHLFSDIDATKEQTDSMMNYRQFGQEDLNNYIECFLIKVSDSNVKPPARKRRNLKTFSSEKVTVHKQKKEIKDHKTVISCLRKKIAFSKSTNMPVSDLEQFLQLPRAICDADGIPEKGQKSWATAVFKKMYSECFISHLPTDSDINPTAFIVDGMFIINTSPLQIHKTFSEYAAFLFDLWVARPMNQFSATEVHLIFDDPNRHGASPKDIERNRRDTIPQINEFDFVSGESILPSNWRTFISIRSQKRLLVNFLSDEFMKISLLKNIPNFRFVTAGGFDGQHRDHAMCTFNNSISEYSQANGDHEEADTRVWLHTKTSSCTKIIIYSPDTDTYFIGLPLIKDLNKSVFVQLKDSPYEKVFLDLNKFVSALQNDVCFQGITEIEKCIQILYIFSGCDFVSYFKGFGKKTFFDVFRKNAKFITGRDVCGHLYDVGSQQGLFAFYRLIASVYFSKHCSAFLPISNIKSLFDTLEAEIDQDKHEMLISKLREVMWQRVLTEVDIMPNAEALRLHWLRSIWVFNYWSQSTDNFLKLLSLSDFGWSITDNFLQCVWDSDFNFQKVERTVDWYTKGCGCKTGCRTNRCKCRKLKTSSPEGFCCPGCKCINCVNLPTLNNDQSQNLDFSLSDVLLEPADDIESENGESDDSDSDSDTHMEDFPLEELETVYPYLQDTDF